MRPPRVNVKAAGLFRPPATTCRPRVAVWAQASGAMATDGSVAMAAAVAATTSRVMMRRFMSLLRRRIVAHDPTVPRSRIVGDREGYHEAVPSREPGHHHPVAAPRLYRSG